MAKTVLVEFDELRPGETPSRLCTHAVDAPSWDAVPGKVLNALRLLRDLHPEKRIYAEYGDAGGIVRMTIADETVLDEGAATWG